MSERFEGFSKKTFSFLRGLAKHNDKAWFDAHRGDYDDHVIAPAKAFVVAMGAKLAKLSSDIHAEPRVNGSIFRFNRDVRFSKDKTPYKTHLDMWFWEGPSGRRSKECPGHFFRMTPSKLIVGAGLHVLDGPRLARYREAVADDARGKQLEKAIAKIAKDAEVTLGGSHYKRVPRGYDPEHPRSELLRHNGLHAAWEGKVPDEVYGPTFVDFCFRRFKQLRPLQQWVVELCNEG